MQSAKPNFGEIVCGIVMLALGIGLLFGARSALLYHTPIYMKGPLDPWQAIIGGSLCAGLGLFMVIHGFCRKKKSRSDA
jgi:hypothetical protein